MSALTPWDPFRELDELQNRLATMFGRIPQRQGARTGNEAKTTADWALMADISEDENAFLLKLDLPEVPKDAVRVSAENGVLTISSANWKKRSRARSSTASNVPMAALCAALSCLTTLIRPR